ncbi:CLUMA_CG001735, isoform A [Clunio marinus]|uniref:CLUMA_CG001735, isoform A n=1 Tax=Clunio marinus TaxID=568069 RepID=A0A1J1HIV9_9DIPT|nr:CLUMA_CG001735, isoform A [Clunio marinus]
MKERTKSFQCSHRTSLPTQEISLHGALNQMENIAVSKILLFGIRFFAMSQQRGWIISDDFE